MGTREVYEEKLRTGNVYHHDPTIKPGLGSPRCPRCLSLLDSTSENGEWTITPVLHDATAVAGTGIGAMLCAIHGFNTGIPLVQKLVKGPKWLPFVVGLPPLLMYSAASAAFGEYGTWDLGSTETGSRPHIDAGMGYENFWIFEKGIWRSGRSKVSKQGRFGDRKRQLLEVSVHHSLGFEGFQ